MLPGGGEPVVMPKRKHDFSYSYVDKIRAYFERYFTMLFEGSL
jgi:hypothetical protein